MMAGIRGRDTKPEIVVRKMLFANGYRFRINKKIGDARPDIVLPKWNLCIFVHGCFWHSHENCRYASKPKSNVEFWKTKLSRTEERDRKQIENIQKIGWKVGIIWECALKNPEDIWALVELNINSHDACWQI